MKPNNLIVIKIDRNKLPWDDLSGIANVGVEVYALNPDAINVVVIDETPDIELPQALTRLSVEELESIRALFVEMK